MHSNNLEGILGRLRKKILQASLPLMVSAYVGFYGIVAATGFYAHQWCTREHKELMAQNPACITHTRGGGVYRTYFFNNDTDPEIDRVVVLGVRSGVRGPVVTPYKKIIDEKNPSSTSLLEEYRKKSVTQCHL